MSLRIETYALHGSFSRYTPKRSLSAPLLVDLQSPQPHLKLKRCKSETDAEFEFGIPLHVRADRPIAFGFQTVTMDDILPEALS